MRTLIFAFLVLCSCDEISPTAEDWYAKGLEKYNLEDYSGAVADYSKAIELDPRHADAYLKRGIVKENLDDYRGAVADYTKVIDLKPKDANAFHKRGLAKYILGHSGEACLDWSRAGELGDAEAYEPLRKYCN